MLIHDPIEQVYANSVSVFASFCNFSDPSCPNGASPASGVIFRKHGRLFGTAPFKGAHGFGGTVFELVP